MGTPRGTFSGWFCRALSAGAGGPEARCPFFNSVGDRTAGADAAAAAGLHPRACGRICPGRDLALELLASALQVLRAPTDDDAKRVLGR